MTHSHPGTEAPIRAGGTGSPTAKALACHRKDHTTAAKLPVRKAPAGSCPPAGAAETAEQIAARYGAVAKAGVAVQRVAPGVSGLPPLIWDDRKGLVYAVKPDLQRLTFGGRKPQTMTVGDRTWRSMGDMGRDLGISTAAISKAFKAGKLAELVARHTREAAA
jgi:hypothetical protein